MEESMQQCLDLSPQEAETYASILQNVSKLPKSDPRHVLAVVMTWWLQHRKRRLQQQQTRRRRFYRRWKRMLALRTHLMKAKTIPGTAPAMTIESKINLLGGKPGSSVNGGMGHGENHRAKLEPENAEDQVQSPVNDENEVNSLWTQMENDLVLDEDFHKNFHMSRETFDDLLSEIEEALTEEAGEATNTRAVLSIPKKKLAVTVYTLATNEKPENVAELFELDGPATVKAAVLEVCEIIGSALKEKYLLSPAPGQEDLSKAAVEERRLEAEERFEIPQCVGVLGSTDVLVNSADFRDASTYISQYCESPALVFQAAVNDQGLFLHVSGGLPGGLQNSTVLEKSNLPEFMETAFKELEKQFDTVKVPAVLVAYDNSWKSPSLHASCILTPFKPNELDNDPQTYERFNEKVDQARNVFDQAIVRLRGRFQAFHGEGGRIAYSAEDFMTVATACAILHNICEVRTEDFDPTWAKDISEFLLIRSLEDDDEPMDTDAADESEENMSEADEIRNILAYACCTEEA